MSNIEVSVASVRDVCRIKQQLLFKEMQSFLSQIFKLFI